MATVEASAVKAKIADIEALICRAASLPTGTVGSEARAELDALLGQIPEDAGGTAAGTWSTLTEGQQSDLCSKLDALQRRLACALFPTGKLMSPAPTPTFIIVGLLLFALAGTIVDLWQIASRWDAAHQGTGSVTQRQSAFALAKSLAEESAKRYEDLRNVQRQAETQLAAQASSTDPKVVADATQTVNKAKADAGVASALAEQRWAAAIQLENRLGPASHDVIVMVILLGMLGGFIHLATSLTMFVGNRDLKQSWTVYYLLAPMQGAAIAPIFYLLLKAAVLSPQLADGTTGNLNLTGIYAIAALSGMFAKQSIEKLADVFATLFAKVKAKDTTKDGANAAS